MQGLKVEIVMGR